MLSFLFHCSLQYATLLINNALDSFESFSSNSLFLLLFRFTFVCKSKLFFFFCPDFNIKYAFSVSWSNVDLSTSSSFEILGTRFHKQWHHHCVMKNAYSQNWMKSCYTQGSFLFHTFFAWKSGGRKWREEIALVKATFSGQWRLL